MQSGSFEPACSASATYLENSRDVQERLHELLTQLSGFALLGLTKRNAMPLCAGPLDLAETRLRDVRERLRGLRPKGHRAVHHHYHLKQAFDAVERSLTMAFERLRPSAVAKADWSDLTRMLRASLDHLHFTTRLLPGFAMIDLRQACCAAHAPRQDQQFLASAI
jgi:hypothetical protein